jgi:predicted deacylase
VRLRASRWWACAVLLVCAAPAAAETPAPGAIELLGARVAPGERRELSFLTEPSFVGAFANTMVLVARGARPGPTLCLTAGIHGDELNGFEIAYRTYSGLDPAALAGTLIAVPAVNAFGFRTGSRYLPDRRDLNRFFPGSARGSIASRLAGVVFEQVIRRCDALIDLHTGSFQRTNQPQIRTDLGDPRALALAQSFGSGVVLHGRGPKGSLRRAALDAGIVAVIYEAGEPLRFEEQEIGRGVEGIANAMADLGMTAGRATRRAGVVFRSTRWVRAERVGGVFLSGRKPGERVARGDLLGTVTDPITHQREEVRAPADGQIIGMAVPQVVLVGYGLFHLGTDEVSARGSAPSDLRGQRPPAPVTGSSAVTLTGSPPVKR